MFKIILLLSVTPILALAGADVNYIWVNQKNPGLLVDPSHVKDGTCYSVEKINGVQKKVENTLCKTNLKTTKMWFGEVVDRDALKGVIPGSENSSVGGHCYEVDEKTKGKNYKVQIEDYDCSVGLELTKKWLGQINPGLLVLPFSVRNGHCYLVDKLTSGKKYQKLIDDKQCKESISTEFKWFKPIVERQGVKKLIPGSLYADGGGDCYEVDDKTKGEQYKVKVQDEFCDVNYKAEVFDSRLDKAPAAPSDTNSNTFKKALTK